MYVLCSTPFGITEVGTVEKSPGRDTLSSAQRLSASQRSALARTVKRDGEPLCSTPFGITEVGTTVVGYSLKNWRCAQRLSASQRSAHRF